MDLTERWDRWCDRFDAADREVGVLFHTRQLWWATTKMWTDNAADIKLNNIVQNHFVRQYVATQCVGIRRECDDDRHTSSVLWCLNELIKFPDMIDRARFEAIVDADPTTKPQYKQVTKTKYSKLAQPGAAGLDVAAIEADRTYLTATAVPVRAYTNKVLAHREHTATIDLKWAELDKALNAVGELVKKYYLLRSGGKIKGNLTPDLSSAWDVPFRTAWAPDGISLPSHNVLDHYVQPVP
jgi:hypothetical protein